jgi:hypothetical protein
MTNDLTGCVGMCMRLKMFTTHSSCEYIGRILWSLEPFFVSGYKIKDTEKLPRELDVEGGGGGSWTRRAWGITKKCRLFAVLPPLFNIFWPEMSTNFRPLSKKIRPLCKNSIFNTILSK